MKATHNPPTTAAVTPADLLRMAALYVRRHGWTQGDYYTIVFDAATPRACVSGAIAMAAYGTATDFPFGVDRPERPDFRTALGVLRDFLDLSCTSRLFGWNDKPGRTADDVINALTAAADQWDSLHTQGGDNR